MIAWEFLAIAYLQLIYPDATPLLIVLWIMVASVTRILMGTI